MREVFGGGKTFSHSLAHSRPGRGDSKSSHIHYAAEGGSRFRALAVTHRHGGSISYDGISCSPLFFGSCRGPGWVPHERERTQKIANYRRKKTRENKGVLLIQTAHNGLVAGSSPAGPTSLRSRSERRLPRRSPKGEGGLLGPRATARQSLPTPEVAPARHGE